MWLFSCGPGGRIVRILKLAIRLIRYCGADVLSLVLLAQHLSGVDGCDTSELWSHLPAVEQNNTARRVQGRHALTTNLFGSASPSRLRTRRRFSG